MIVASLLALSLFGHPLLEPVQTTTKDRHVGGWTVRVTWDRFTGHTECTLRKGQVELQKDVLVFHSAKWIDTADALFRIDGGAVRNVHEATYEDERRGYYRDGGPLENPSRGEVALPTSYLTGAKWVYIRTNPNRAPDAFDVRGFSDALALARAQKCPRLDS